MAIVSLTGVLQETFGKLGKITILLKVFLFRLAGVRQVRIR